MTSALLPPPGYEHRQLPRSVKPDVPKIEALLRQKGWSEQHFAGLCGRGDAGFFRHWKKVGATCYVRTLVRVAQVFELEHWWELWADYVAPAPASVKRTEDEALIEDLSVKTLLNPTQGLSATGQPVATENFFNQVVEKFPDLTRPLLDNKDAFRCVFTDLELMGWLIANDDGTFSRRYWTMLECMTSIEYRCGAEDGAMLAVAMLQNPRWDDATANIKLYDEIVADQWDRLQKMKNDHRLVIQDHDEDAATRIIRDDDLFHHGWSYSPCTKTSFGFALKTIDQSTNRFIETLKRCNERGIEVPKTFPTLPVLVQNYYPQLEDIFSKFVTVKPNDVERMLAIRQMLRRHAMDGFNTASGAEMLIERWPLRPKS